MITVKCDMSIGPADVQDQFGHSLMVVTVDRQHLLHLRVNIEFNPPILKTINHGF